MRRLIPVSFHSVPSKWRSASVPSANASVLDRTNMSPDNIEVIPKGLHSKAKRLATVEAKLEEWNKEYYSLTGKVYVYEP